MSDSPRDSSLQIDFTSSKVIQCQGELAALGDDEVRTEIAYRDLKKA